LTNQKKKILFIINGLGLGNSTRCKSIIDQLVARNLEVDIITSGNGVDFFKNDADVQKRYAFSSLYYGSSSGKLNILKTIAAIPQLIKIYLNNLKLLKDVTKKNLYAAIVIDSDYTVAGIRHLLKIPIVAINNSDIVVDTINSIKAIPKSIWSQLMIEKLDLLFHKFVATKVLSPTLGSADENGKYHLGGEFIPRRKFNHFSPFVRDQWEPKIPNKTPVYIVVMLSGSNLGSKVDFIKKLNLKSGIHLDVIGRDGESQSNIKFHGKLSDNKKLISRADLLVINAGFSAVSEAMVLKKPTVVLPIENHAEQYVNGKRVEDLGLGVVANEDNIHDKIEYLIKNYQEFLKRHEQYNIPANGSELAALDIMELVSDSREKLS
jgi:uncharacterized protein (TIGR00661 family)